MKPNRLSQVVPWVLVALTPLSGGCLSSEEWERRIVVEEGDILTITDTFYNLQGNGHDFDLLVRCWKEDEFLIDTAKDRKYVVTRRLWLEEEKLTGMVQMLSYADDIFDDKDKLGVDSMGYWQSVDTSSVELVSTNGSVSLSDTALIVRWPPSTRELVVRTKDRNFSSEEGFADYFHAYLGEEKRGR